MKYLKKVISKIDLEDDNFIDPLSQEQIKNIIKPRLATGHVPSCSPPRPSFELSQVDPRLYEHNGSTTVLQAGLATTKKLQDICLLLQRLQSMETGLQAHIAYLYKEIEPQFNQLFRKFVTIEARIGQVIPALRSARQSLATVANNHGKYRRIRSLTVRQQHIRLLLKILHQMDSFSIIRQVEHFEKQQRLDGLSERIVFLERCAALRQDFPLKAVSCLKQYKEQKLQNCKKFILKQIQTNLLSFAENRFSLLSASYYLMLEHFANLDPLRDFLLIAGRKLISAAARNSLGKCEAAEANQIANSIIQSLSAIFANLLKLNSWLQRNQGFSISTQLWRIVEAQLSAVLSELNFSECRQVYFIYCEVGRLLEIGEAIVGTRPTCFDEVLGQACLGLTSEPIEAALKPLSEWVRMEEWARLPLSDDYFHPGIARTVERFLRLRAAGSGLTLGQLESIENNPYHPSILQVQAPAFQPHSQMVLCHTAFLYLNFIQTALTLRLYMPPVCNSLTAQISNLLDSYLLFLLHHFVPEQRLLCLGLSKSALVQQLKCYKQSRKPELLSQIQNYLQKQKLCPSLGRLLTRKSKLVHKWGRGEQLGFRPRMVAADSFQSILAHIDFLNQSIPGTFSVDTNEYRRLLRQVKALLIAEAAASIKNIVEYADSIASIERNQTQMEHCPASALDFISYLLDYKQKLKGQFRGEVTPHTADQVYGQLVKSACASLISSVCKTGCTKTVFQLIRQLKQQPGSKEEWFKGAQQFMQAVKEQRPQVQLLQGRLRLRELLFLYSQEQVFGGLIRMLNQI